MGVVVVVPPSGGRNFHTGAPIDAPFIKVRGSTSKLGRAWEVMKAEKWCLDTQWSGGTTYLCVELRIP
ncbi:hypothetical protein PIB30_106910, partial [Stylosanthes scabra]|nr:hypothetical protein [Stylosanthes scabra]